MRFMIMHKMTEEMEKGLPLDPAIIQGVGKLVGEGVKDEVFVSGEWLKPSSQRVRIAYRSGQRTITHGPFTDAKQLAAGFALMRVRSKDEAIAWCDRLAAAFGDVELFLGPVVEAWDLGVAPKPEAPLLRFVSMHEADECSESGKPQDPKIRANMAALNDEMTKASVLEATSGLESTTKGARIRFEGDGRTVIHGPFAESKLVAGYAILDLPSMAAAIEWAKHLGDVIKVNEVDVRQMAR